MFEYTVAITVPSVTDEQINNLVQIVNEKYEKELATTDIKTIKVPAIKVFDVVSNYIWPAVAIVIAGAVYMAIRYWKLGIIKVILSTICFTVIAEALLASIYLIARIPVNEFAMPASMLILGFTLLSIGVYFDKKLEKLKDSEEE